MQAHSDTYQLTVYDIYIALNIYVKPLKTTGGSEDCNGFQSTLGSYAMQRHLASSILST